MGARLAAVAALALPGKLTLKREDVATAVDFSIEAVTSLLSKHPLPALRAEEVHLNHYRVMQAPGRPRWADLALDRAYAILQEKA